MNDIQKKRCLIFGGGGFIGSHLAEGLLSLGYIVRIFDIQHFNRNNIFQIEDSLEIVEGDFNNKVDIQTSLTNVDYVFHLVSTTIPSVSMKNLIYDIESNLVSSIHLLDACINSNIQKLVFISSGGTVYGIPKSVPITEDHSTLPISSYGIIKNTIEHYCILYKKLYGLNCSIFRLSNPYGERQNPYGKQGVIPVFLNKILLDQEIEIWGDGEVVRDYIYIKDVVNLLAKSISFNQDEAIFNLGSGIGYSLNELLLIIEEILQKKAIVKYIEKRSFDVPINILDISKAKDSFNWNPNTDIKQGIEIVTKYLKSNIKRL